MSVTSGIIKQSFIISGRPGPPGIPGPPGDDTSEEFIVKHEADYPHESLSALTVNNGILKLIETSIGLESGVNALPPGSVYAKTDGSLSIVPYGIDELPIVAAVKVTTGLELERNLTDIGYYDWLFAGVVAANPSSLTTNNERKNVASHLISEITKTAGGTVSRQGVGVGAVGPFAWSDGTSVTTATGRAGGLSIDGAGNGLSFTITPDGEPVIINLFLWHRDVESKVTLMVGDVTTEITEGFIDTNANTPARITFAYTNYQKPITIKVENVTSTGGVSTIHAVTAGKTLPEGSSDIAAVWEYATSERDQGSLHLSGGDWDIPSEDGIRVIKQLHQEFNYTVSYNL